MILNLSLVALTSVLLLSTFQTLHLNVKLHEVQMKAWQFDELSSDIINTVRIPELCKETFKDVAIDPDNSEQLQSVSVPKENNPQFFTGRKAGRVTISDIKIRLQSKRVTLPDNPKSEHKRSRRSKRRGKGGLGSLFSSISDRVSNSGRWGSRFPKTNQEAGKGKGLGSMFPNKEEKKGNNQEALDKVSAQSTELGAWERKQEASPSDARIGNRMGLGRNVQSGSEERNKRRGLNLLKKIGQRLRDALRIILGGKGNGPIAPIGSVYVGDLEVNMIGDNETPLSPYVERMVFEVTDGYITKCESAELWITLKQFGKCPNGQIWAGFDSNGTILCQKGPPGPPGPPGAPGEDSACGPNPGTPGLVCKTDGQTASWGTM